MIGAFHCLAQAIEVSSSAAPQCSFGTRLLVSKVGCFPCSTRHEVCSKMDEAGFALQLLVRASQGSSSRCGPWLRFIILVLSGSPIAQDLGESRQKICTTLSVLSAAMPSSTITSWEAS
jgi:hypothetical protein